VVWWGALVECSSAIARLERDALLDPRSADTAFHRLDSLARRWSQVEPRDIVRESARRLLRTHPLRAADALQLAAAIFAAEQRPSTLAVVCLDTRLAVAASKEGFEVAVL
jgi:predicted nucleic acid-binding protein